MGWMASLLISPGFPHKVCQLSTDSTSFYSQQQNDDMWLNMSSLVRLGRGPEKTVESHIVFAYVHTHSTFILVTCDWHHQESLPPTWITVLLCVSLATSSTSPALPPRIHLTRVTGVANFTFFKMELPIIRAGLSVGVSLSREDWGTGDNHHVELQ